MQNVMAEWAVSVFELKRIPSAVMNGAHGGAQLQPGHGLHGSN